MRPSLTFRAKESLGSWMTDAGPRLTSRQPSHLVSRARGATANNFVACSSSRVLTQWTQAGKVVLTAWNEVWW